jgi:hypothetical protein
LVVSLDGEPPYETGIRAVMQRNSASHFPPGTEVPVRIDPQDHTRVALDASRAPWLQNILM